MMSIRLLLVSDYAMLRDGIRLLLGRADEIKLIGEAESLAKAPQKFRELQPDVVLLDEPAVAGSSSLRAVSLIVQCSADARAVVLTSNDDVSYVRSILAVGARGYVLKHSSSPELIRAVRSAASGQEFIDPRLSEALVANQRGDKWKLSRLPLTEREVDIVRDLARGYTNAQIAGHLNLTRRTIETYRARIYRKLHLHNRAELVHYAAAHGLLS
jgi:two-component system, NarL family, response regulator NreC